MDILISMLFVLFFFKISHCHDVRYIHNMNHSQNSFSFVKLIVEKSSLQQLLTVLNDLPYNVINYCWTVECWT